MKRLLIISIIVLCLFLVNVDALTAQCSICAKTTQQMGEKPAKGFNTGIIYLMLTPFAVVAFIGYKWWKGNGRDSHFHS